MEQKDEFTIARESAARAGFEFAETQSWERHEPLSGEFAGDPLTSDVLRPHQELLANDIDEDEILDAWEEGYRASFEARRATDGLFEVTPGMTSVQALNAILSRNAWRQDGFGYDADPVHWSNYRRLIEDHPNLLESTVSPQHVTHAQLIEGQPSGEWLLGGHYVDLAETLGKLSRDYPLYDDEDHSKLVNELLVKYLESNGDAGQPEPWKIARAIHELSIEHQDTDGSIFVRTEDYNAAVEHARTMED